MNQDNNENDLEDLFEENPPGNNIAVINTKKKKKKSSSKGNIQVEETRTKNGMQRKVIRDLGNGVKSVEITEVINRGQSNSSNFSKQISLLLFIYLL